MGLDNLTQSLNELEEHKKTYEKAQENLATELNTNLKSVPDDVNNFTSYLVTLVEKVEQAEAGYNIRIDDVSRKIKDHYSPLVDILRAYRPYNPDEKAISQSGIRVKNKSVGKLSDKINEIKQGIIQEAEKYRERGYFLSSEITKPLGLDTAGNRFDRSNYARAIMSLKEDGFLVNVVKINVDRKNISRYSFPGYEPAGTSKGTTPKDQIDKKELYADIGRIKNGELTNNDVMNMYQIDSKSLAGYKRSYTVETRKQEAKKK